MVKVEVKDIDKTEERFFEGHTLDDLLFAHPDLEGSLIFVKKEGKENYSLINEGYEFLKGDEVKVVKY